MKIIHKQGKDNIMEDALSRKEEYMSLFLKEEVYSLDREGEWSESPLKKEIRLAYKHDEKANELLRI